MGKQVKVYDIVSSPYEVQGVVNEYVTHIDLDKSMEIKQLDLTLDAKMSPLLDGEFSHLTVEINDKPVSSMRMEELIESPQLLEDLNTEYLVEGYNKLAIKTHTVIGHESICHDDETTGNWFTLNPDTKLEVTYNKLESQTIHEFLRQVDKSSAGRVYEISNPKNYESLSFSLSASLGRDVKLVTADQVSKNDNQRIMLDLVNQLPKDLQSDFKALKENEFAMKLYTEKSGSEVLVVTAQSKESLMNAMPLLNDYELNHAVLNTDDYLGSDSLVANQPKVEVELKKPFLDNSVYFSSATLHEASYYVDYPENRMLQSESSIVLKMKYSDNLDFDKSLMTVLVNGEPIGSKKLEQAHANGDEFEVFIPSSLHINGNFNIKIQFDLMMDYDWCEQREPETPWAYLESDSYVSLHSQKQENAFMEYYPYPFVEDYELLPTTIVVPDKYTEEVLWLVSNIWNSLTNDLKTEAQPIQIMSASEVTEQLAQQQLIVVGTPKTNSFLEKHYQTNELAATEGLIQLTKNPFNPEQDMMILSDQSTSELYEIINFVNNDNLHWQLQGDQIFIDNETVLQTNYLEEVAVVDEADSQNQPEPEGFHLVIGIVIIMAILASGLGLYKYYNKKTK